MKRQIPLIIYIEIKGPVQSGKSTIMSTIKKLLEDHNYCVAVPERSERNNPSNTLDNANYHEKPKHDGTVIVLTENLI